MSELRKFVAPEIVYGTGAAEFAGQHARNLDITNCLLVTDEGVSKQHWFPPILESLSNEGIKYSIFASVSENPREHEVMSGAEMYTANNCDGIVTIGGGSPMDCAKGIGIVTTNKQNILRFEGVDMVNNPIPPLVCIPTTAGSSADVSQFAIVTDTTRKVKIAIVSKAIVPDVALIDPYLTTTMDPQLTAATGLDALTHAIEAYASNANSHITDLFAKNAVGLVLKNLIGAINEPDNIEYRDGMMRASMEAGLAFSNAILGAVHAMAHSLGGLLDLPHGECNAILLPLVIDMNFSSAPERYIELAKTAGLQVDDENDQEQWRRALVTALTELKEAAGIHHTLEELGVTKADLHALAQKALQDPCMITNPADLNEEEIVQIYERAL
ncbi:MAG: alcohol dehydrogenase-like regulatory protein ErcA [Desulfovibrio sp.]